MNYKKKLHGHKATGRSHNIFRSFCLYLAKHEKESYTAAHLEAAHLFWTALSKAIQFYLRRNNFHS